MAAQKKAGPAQRKIAKAKHICVELEKDVTRCVALLANWKRVNSRKDIKSRYDHTYEAHSLNTISEAVHITLIMALMRMHDGDERSASIPTLLNLLNDPHVINELKKKTAAQNNNIDEWHKSAKIRFARLKNDQILKSIKKLRHSNLAHINLKTFQRHGAKYGFETRLLKRTAPIVRLLLLIVKSRDVDFSELQKISRMYADRFWRTAAKSPKI